MAYATADIRNVCLVGPAHAGKTQLAEALLFAGGAIKEAGSVEGGNTVCDFATRERQQGHSLYPSVCHFTHAGIHVNLLDTPGYRDLYGRAVSVLPAAETAAIVIDAVAGVDTSAQRVMEAALGLSPFTIRERRSKYGSATYTSSIDASPAWPAASMCHPESGEVGRTHG